MRVGVLLKKFRRGHVAAAASPRIFPNMNHRFTGITPGGRNKSDSLHGPNESPIYPRNSYRESWLILNV